MQRILMFGGRDFNDVARVDAALRAYWERYTGPWFTIQGGAKGADTLCRDWALARGWPVVTMHAPWDSHLGKSAGYWRNQWMVQWLHPTYAIGFPGGHGTRDMTARLKAAGVTTWLP